MIKLLLSSQMVKDMMNEFRGCHIGVILRRAIKMTLYEGHSLGPVIVCTSPTCASPLCIYMYTKYIIMDSGIYQKL